eukprot:1150502-Pelagomonas_calceolata.AAC.9
MSSNEGSVDRVAQAHVCACVARERCLATSVMGSDGQRRWLLLCCLIKIIGAIGTKCSLGCMRESKANEGWLTLLAVTGETAVLFLPAQQPQLSEDAESTE